MVDIFCGRKCINNVIIKKKNIVNNLLFMHKINQLIYIYIYIYI
jgi:hypothetical protein